MTTADTRRTLGRRGEEAAAKFLLGRGLTLLDRNWRNGRDGEVDLIFGEGRQAIFVEVKTRTETGASLLAVDHRKMHRLRRLAGAWLAAHPGWTTYRIDVIGIDVRPPAAAHLTWLQGADR